MGDVKKMAEIEACSDIEVMSAAQKHIKDFCDLHSFSIPYIRIWNENGETNFDVGSHTEFFHLKPEVDYYQL